MEALLDHIMEDSDIKSRFTGDNSSTTSNEDESLLSLIDFISSKKANLLDLVVALEKYHTQGTVEQRSKSITVLGAVIHEIANLGLDSKALVALSQFFVSKLRDVHCVLPAMRAIYDILKYHPVVVKESQTLGDGCLTVLLTGISSPSIHIPAYNQKVRMMAYK